MWSNYLNRLTNCIRLLTRMRKPCHGRPVFMCWVIHERQRFRVERGCGGEREEDTCVLSRVVARECLIFVEIPLTFSNSCMMLRWCCQCYQVVSCDLDGGSSYTAPHQNTFIIISIFITYVLIVTFITFITYPTFITDVNR